MHFPFSIAPRSTRRTTRSRRLDERGVAFPSPLVMLSVLAVAMAGIAFVATNGNEEPEQEVVAVAQPEATPEADAEAAPEPEARKAPKPVNRAKVLVEVYNNSGITGLAGTTSTTLTEIGWQVVGSDNWYGNIPASTVYFPEGRKRAARTLARDLGIKRVSPSVEPMRLDRLTVILTKDFS